MTYGNEDNVQFYRWYDEIDSFMFNKDDTYNSIFNKDDTDNSIFNKDDNDNSIFNKDDTDNSMFNKDDTNTSCEKMIHKQQNYLIKYISNTWESISCFVLQTTIAPFVMFVHFLW